MDLGERQAHALRRRFATRTTMRDARDEDVVHLDDEELLLVPPGLAMCDGGVLEVRTGGTRLHQRRRCLIDPMDDGQVLKGRLARARAGSPAKRHVTRVRDTPGKREDFDFVLVL